MILQPNVGCRCCCSAHGALTALMMLVWPEPGIQPVTTITMSPDLKNPRAFPDKRQRARVKPLPGSQAGTREALTDVHAKVDPAVDVVGPDGSRQRVEEDREHPPQELGLTGHLRKTTEVRPREENGTGSVD